MLGEQNGRRDHLRTIGVTQEENEMSLPRVHWGEREVDWRYIIVEEQRECADGLAIDTERKTYGLKRSQVFVLRSRGTVCSYTRLSM